MMRCCDFLHFCINIWTLLLRPQLLLLQAYLRSYRLLMDLLDGNIGVDKHCVFYVRRFPYLFRLTWRIVAFTLLGGLGKSDDLVVHRRIHTQTILPLCLYRGCQIEHIRLIVNTFMVRVLSHRHFHTRRWLGRAKANSSHVTTRRHSCEEHCVGPPLPLALESYQFEIFWNRRRRDWHFSSHSSVHIAFVFIELTFEIKVAKITGRSIQPRAWRSKSRVITPSRAFASRAEVFDYRWMKVWTYLITFGYIADLLVVTRTRWLLILIFPSSACVHSCCFWIAIRNK